MARARAATSLTACPEWVETVTMGPSPGQNRKSGGWPTTVHIMPHEEGGTGVTTSTNRPLFYSGMSARDPRGCSTSTPKKDRVHHVSAGDLLPTPRPSRSNAMAPPHDAVVIGAGPNGLAAAITLALSGRSVLVLEAASEVGGGSRSAELTLPGFVHDTCSAIHPLAVASPFFRELPLADHGLEWVHPPVAVAHPFEEGAGAVLEGSVEDTARLLGRDGDGYRRLLEPVTSRWRELSPILLGPPRIPSRILPPIRFALRGIRSARSIAEGFFQERNARGLFAGLAAHSTLPLERTASAGVALLLGAAGHVDGWPMPRGGAQRLADALAGTLRSLGGEIELNQKVVAFRDLPAASAYLFDLTPRQVLRIAGGELPGRYRRRLERFRYGPGVFKIDWALDAPIPWKDPTCRRAGTVHLGGDFDDVARAEHAVWQGEHPERPFVLLAQQSLFDDTRAPPRKHSAWAYCHVPHRSTWDMTSRIEEQVERYAPGFRDLILARHTFNTREFEAHNPNYVGGDIAGGTQDLSQIVGRPILSWVPYATPNPKIYLCSSSTPPGGGVHGMAGYHAARAVIRRQGG